MSYRENFGESLFIYRVLLLELRTLPSQQTVRLTICRPDLGKMVFTVTLKGQLGLNIKAGPNGKSIEVTLVKPNASADEWLVETSPANFIRQ